MTDVNLTLPLVIVTIAFVAWRHINIALFSDPLSPFNLLFWFWVLPLCLRLLNLSGLEQQWNFEAIVAIGTVSALLLGTCVVPAMVGRRLPPLSLVAPRFTLAGQALNLPKTTMLLCALFVAGFFLYVYMEFLLNPGGFLLIDALRDDLTTETARYYNWLRDEGRTPLFSLALIFTSFLPLLCGVLYLKFRFEHKPLLKLLYLVLALQMLLFGLIKLSKTDAAFALLILVMAELYWRRLKPYPALKYSSWSIGNWLFVALLVVGAGFVMFYSTAVFRAGESIDDQSRIAEILDLRYADGGIVNLLVSYIYGYSVLNFENAARFISSYDGGLNLGLSALRPILSVVMQGGIADEMAARIDWNTVTRGYIAGTFITPIYAESQWAGLLIWPLVYGGLVNWTYLMFRRTGSIWNLLLYMNFAFCWAFMFFSNAFATLPFYTNAAFVVLISIVVNQLRTSKISSRDYLAI